jgi:Protein of unknown function (DUF3891)
VIIQRRGNDLICIAQVDHAALAAEIMSHWRLGGLPQHPRRDAILEATRLHDDGWREEDAQLHVSEVGEPLDFIAVPPAVKLRIWPRATERLASRSPYVAALVAQHALTVHAPLRQDRAWQQFFATMERARDTQLSRAAADEAAGALDDYPFVRIGDQLSLIFCNGWTTPMSGLGYRAILRDITLEITPDPFEGRRVPLRVDARWVAARTFGSAADFRDAYASAPVIPLEGEAAGVQP